MNILLCVNRDYVMPAVVMLASLAAHHPSDDLTVYVMHLSLAPGDQDALKSGYTAHPRLRFHFIAADGALPAAAHTSGHISREAYLRVFAFQHLPAAVERVLYIDADILINKSLEAFYRQPFEGALLVACEDRTISRLRRDVYENLSLPPGARYFNSGLLLMNLDGMRRMPGLSDALSAYIMAQKDKLLFHDQDVLNHHFLGRVRYADPDVYNCLAPSLLSGRARRRALQNAAVLHFAGRWKPWRGNYRGGLDGLFWRYAAGTAYADRYPAYRRAHALYACIPYGPLAWAKKTAKALLQKDTPMEP